MTHGDCFPGAAYRCFGLSCQCGFSACIAESFDHKCPLASVNVSWSLFLMIAAVALVVVVRGGIH